MLERMRQNDASAVACDLLDLIGFVKTSTPNVLKVKSLSGIGQGRAKHSSFVR